MILTTIFLHQHSYPGNTAATTCKQAPAGGGLRNYNYATTHYINLSIIITIHTIDLCLHTCPGRFATTARNQATSGGGLGGRLFINTLPLPRELG